MRKQRLFFRLACLAAALCLLCACGAKQQPQNTSAPSEDAVPTAVPTPSPTPVPVPTAQVEQCAGAYFPDISGSPNLYAAVEFTNTGVVPAAVESIRVTIAFDDQTVKETFTPPLAENDIVEPGARSTVAVWIPYTKSTPSEGAAFSVSAEVTLTASTDRDKDPLTVENLVLVQNYPGFSTVSGRLQNPTDDRDYSLTLVYLSFYDETGALLGVTHFTKNLAVPATESRDFVTHLRALPIDGLPEKTARIVARGIGIR